MKKINKKAALDWKEVAGSKSSSDLYNEDAKERKCMTCGESDRFAITVISSGSFDECCINCGSANSFPFEGMYVSAFARCSGCGVYRPCREINIYDMSKVGSNKISKGLCRECESRKNSPIAKITTEV